MDAQDRPALAALRCLHQAGFTVGATASSELAPGLWSRACSGRRVLPAPAAGIEPFVAGLEKLLREQRYDVVLAGTDETLYAISEHRDRLAPHVRLGLPDRDAVIRALDKRCLAGAAERVGIGHPESRLCPGRGEAAAAAREFGFPVVVKGLRTIAARDGRLVRYPTRLVADDAALSTAQRQLGTCIVQRREAGAVVSYGGVVTEQGMLGAVVSRYRRTWPPEAGSVSFSETISPDPALTGQVQALARALGWRGLFELELIERDDGAIKAIDFNPRLYGSLTLGAAAGAPLAALWCEWLLGQNPRPAAARTGIAYRWEDADVRHALWLLRGRQLRAGVSALVPRRGTAHAYFRARDPLPLAMRAVELGQVRWRRRRARTGAAG